MKIKTNNSEDLRGVFFIVKGQYNRSLSPTFINEVTKSEMCLGGYDPSGDNTIEHYMVLDNITFNCVCSSGDFEVIKKGIQKAILHFKTKERYLREVSECDWRTKVSKPMKCLYEEIYKTYGDYYEDIVEEQEDIAYGDSSFKTPLQRSADIKKKIPVKKLVTKKEVVTPSKKEVVSKKPVLKKKLSVKKLSLV